MRKTGSLFTVITTALLPFGLAASVSGQVTAVPTPEHPPMASQRYDRDKESLYATFSENKRVASPEQQQRAYVAAREFVRRYGGDGDSYAKEVRAFVAEFEKSISQYEIFSAYGTKNYAKAFELGRPILKTEPENFFVLGVLAEAGYENALGGNASLNDETIDYLRRAIQLVETGKVSKVDPFISTDAAAGFLNLALGWFMRDKAPVEAAAALVKAVKPKSPYENDPLPYYRLGVALLKGEFAQLSAEYNDKYGSREPSAEQQAMVQRINRVGERAVDAYARAIALSDPKRPSATANSQFTPELREKVLVRLTLLYKGYHNNSDAGLADFIAGVLSKPLP